MMRCNICGNSENNSPYTVREMMLGTKDMFEYFQCGECGCLQIQNIPDNIFEYYPKTYHSYAEPSTFFSSSSKNKIKGIRDYLVLTLGGKAREILVKFTKVDTLLPVVSRLALKRSHNILDIGCGSGVLLYALNNAGFKRVIGIDPFISREIRYKNGLTILKKTIFEHSGMYDVIMMHHAFEHMNEQVKVLQRVRELLSDTGKVLIRIPTVSSRAWDLYKTCWVQLDAPRHFFLHSIKSFQWLAAAAGFRIDNIIYDSASFQFWGSELYKKDVPLNGTRISDHFTNEQLNKFARAAQELNENREGDQVAIFLSKKK